MDPEYIFLEAVAKYIDRMLPRSRVIFPDLIQYVFDTTGIERKPIHMKWAVKYVRTRGDCKIIRQKGICKNP